MERISGAGPDDVPLGGFGARLTPETIEAQLAAMNASREVYIESLPEDVARLTSELAEIDQEQQQWRTDTISASVDTVIR